MHGTYFLGYVKDACETTVIYIDKNGSVSIFVKRLDLFSKLSSMQPVHCNEGVTLGAHCAVDKTSWIFCRRALHINCCLASLRMLFTWETASTEQLSEAPSSPFSR